MNEDVELTPEDLEALDASESIDVIHATLDRFLSTADVDAVYGMPLEHGENLIIPAAEVLCGMGFGLGYGGASDSSEEGDNGGYGAGGGGGGRVLSRPVAVIIAGPQGVRVDPVIDPTKIALAALTAGGFMVGMLLRMLKSGD